MGLARVGRAWGVRPNPKPKARKGIQAWALVALNPPKTGE